ncbi:MAG: type I-C CRISPR-associated protein Cas8c/Csd1 [Bacteroidales bacterium]|nr:type I-C CRISPR-associated protein Cas8c/Csd1 [Bacteroidales bacterium]
MIIQALCDYYNRRVATGDRGVAPQGFEWKEIPFIIVIDREGNFIQLKDMREITKERKSCKSFLVAKTRSRTGMKSWQTVNMLWDHSGYVLGYPKEAKDEAAQEKNTETAQKQHGVFRQLVGQLTEKYPRNESFKAVRMFYDNEKNKEQLYNDPLWAECLKVAGANMTFQLEESCTTIAEEENLRQFIRESFTLPADNKGKEATGRCMVSGETGPIATLHSPVPIGANRAMLVSFQRNSGYDSYYKEQGANAPISQKVEFAYTTALQLLLGKESQNKYRFSEDTTVLFWAEKSDDKMESFFSSFLKNDDNPDYNLPKIRAVLDSVRSGHLHTDSEGRFYILGLSANKARLVVRFFKQGTTKQLAGNLAHHFDLLNIVKSEKENRSYLSLFTLLCSISPQYKIDNLPPNLMPDVLSAIIEGRSYPITLLQLCLRRIMADRSVSYPRAAILKAYLNSKQPNNITMALDLQNTNQAYLYGRLFAVLEMIQPSVKAGIKARYYNAASTTPVTVFSRLMQLSNYHLAKMDAGRKIFFERIIQGIMDSISAEGIANNLSLDDQARFALGYYHQRTDLFKSKPKDIEFEVETEEE